MTRRSINYYRTRIQVPVETISDHPNEYALYCLPKDGAEALLRITGYLRREVTWIGEYVNDKIFRGPTTTEMEAIVDIIGELEVGLMSGCELETIESELALIRQCVCLWQQQAVAGRAELPDLGPYITAGQITMDRISDHNATPTDPATQEAKCEISQAIYYAIAQMFTEDILPWANASADTLLTALVGTTAMSAIATGVGIPVAVVTGLVSAVVTWGIDSSIADYTNWILGAKDELICAVYENLPDWDACAAAISAFIDAETEPSFLDKFITKQVYGSAWHLKYLAEDQQDNGTWDTYITAGYCSVCEAPVGDCALVDACYLPDWDEGTVGCYSGRARIVGGLAFYTKNTLTLPSAAADLILYWYPRATDYPTAKCRVVMRNAADPDSQYVLGDTPNQAIDAYTASAFEIPLAWQGVTVEIGIGQLTWHCEPVKFCTVVT